MQTDVAQPQVATARRGLVFRNNSDVEVVAFTATQVTDVGKKVVAVRHPTPYGDFARQACQSFETYADPDKHQCIIEEREGYEPQIG